MQPTVSLGITAIGDVRSLEVPPTPPKSGITNYVVSLVSQSFRNREHGTIHFPQNPPAQACLPPDCAHLVNPARNPTFQELVKAFRWLQQPICNVPLDHLRDVPLSDELRRDSPGDPRTFRMFRHCFNAWRTGEGFEPPIRLASHSNPCELLP